MGQNSCKEQRDRTTPLIPPGAARLNGQGLVAIHPPAPLLVPDEGAAPCPQEQHWLWWLTVAPKGRGAMAGAGKHQQGHQNGAPEERWAEQLVLWVVLWVGFRDGHLEKSVAALGIGHLHGEQSPPPHGTPAGMECPAPCIGPG